MSRAHEKRSNRAVTPALAAALSLVLACGGDGGGGKEEPAPDAAASDGGGREGGTPTNDGGGPQQGGDGGSDGGRDGGAPPVVPTLSAATVKQSGRTGSDLRVEFTGGTPKKNLVAVVVVLKDAAGAAIGSERSAPLAMPITGNDGSSYVVLTDLLKGAANYASAEVSLVDALDTRSASMTVPVTPQPMLAANAACDPSYVNNRCPPDLGCKGTPSKCGPAATPVLTRVGYFNDELGPRVLIEGTDSDNDISSYTIRLFAADGVTPVGLNLDMDESTLETVFNGTTAGKTEGDKFFYTYQPDATFVDMVKVIKVTIGDSSGTRVSDEVTATQIRADAKGMSAACDVRGWDRCCGGLTSANKNHECTTWGQLVCSPSSGTAGTCKAVGTARTAQCSSALLLNPQAVGGVSTVRGAIAAPSLWDPAEGCSNQRGNPDAVVKLVLTQPAAKVTLSTDSPYTSFDSELYVLGTCMDPPSLCDPRSVNTTPGWCADNPPQDFWCLHDKLGADDMSIGPNPVLTLTDLTAGDYYVVVDSYPSSTATGNQFQLSVSLE